MNRSIVKFIAIVVAIAMVLTSIAFVFFVPSAYGLTREENQDLEKRLKDLEEYIIFIDENYKDKIDYKDLVKGAFTGATNALKDPFSVYYAEAEEASSFVEEVNQSYDGIGVTITKDDKEVIVTDINFEGPAYKAGLRQGDRISKIDKKEIQNLSLEEVAKLLRGPSGSQIELAFLRNGVAYNLVIVRDRIKNEVVSSNLLAEGIGYIKLTSFSNDAYNQFNMALIALVNKGAEKLIFDVRGNGGGVINEAIKIANYFVNEGYISHFYRQGRLVESQEATKGLVDPLPTVLLIDGHSASATELLAAALKESKTAVLVGNKTYGKGVAQMVGNLSANGGYKLSVFYFVSPQKNEIDGKGVEPDYQVNNRIASDTVKATKLFESFVPMKENIKSTLGSMGLNVYGAQQRLNMIGYNLAVTGTMDSKTVDAMMKFQGEEGLWQYNVLDYTTRDRLEDRAYDYAHGINTRDFQLEKALEILK